LTFASSFVQQFDRTLGVFKGCRIGGIRASSLTQQVYGQLKRGQTLKTMKDTGQMRRDGNAECPILGKTVRNRTTQQEIARHSEPELIQLHVQMKRFPVSDHGTVDPKESYSYTIAPTAELDYEFASC
jgi:hypothetical protein